MASQTILQADVREDLAQAHRTVVADLAEPGDWLRADEKVAVVRVVRAARQQPQQPPWYRPSTDQDNNADFAPLPAAAIDVAWRLTNHPGTLTADWHAQTVAALSSSEYYVELVGVVAVTNAIDRLATMLDFDVLPLPDPKPGEPHEPQIPSAVTTHWVPTALDASGPNVLRAHSVAPRIAELRTVVGAAHYMSGTARADLSWTRGDLDRRQIELVAGITSMHNECFY